MTDTTHRLGTEGLTTFQASWGELLTTVDTALQEARSARTT